jgi:actin
MKAGSAI